MDVIAAAAGIALALFSLRRRARRQQGARRRVCIASCRELIDAAGRETAHYRLTGNDDAHLMRALDNRNVPYDIQAWDSPVDWTQYCAVIVRTTWDYSSSERTASQFRNWLRALSDYQIHVLNDPRLLSWNVHKKYLADLAALPLGADRQGHPVGCIPTIPSVYIHAGCAPSLADLTKIQENKGWTDLLIKPCVGGGSRACMRVKVSEPGALAAGQAFLEHHVQPRAGPQHSAAQEASSPTAVACLPRLHDRQALASVLSPTSANVEAHKLATAAASCVLPEARPLGPEAGYEGGHPHLSGPHRSGDREHVPCDMMVQPYLSSVEEEGELSVIVLDGAITHAVMKSPAHGDFRTQEEHGGSPRALARHLTGEEKAMVHKVLDTARVCVEVSEPPLGTADGAGSPAHADSLLPHPLPAHPILIARVDFLRLTQRVAQALGPVALAEAGLDAESPPPWLLLELEAIEPCLFLAQGLSEGAADKLACAIDRISRAR